MAEIPGDVIESVTRLTRLAREAVDENESTAYRKRRAELLTEYDFAARLRREDDTLVLHPEEWLEDGVVQLERLEDLDRAVEVPLEGQRAHEDWEAVEARNAAVVDELADAHEEVHAANARAFADFMGNHYKRTVDTATAREVREFLEEYYPRNAWPTREQQAVVRESLELLFDAADASVPGFTAERR